MSGICGLFNLDGAPATEAGTSAMLVMLKRWGPDGGGLWSDGPVGLGHSLLTTSPSGGSERQPHSHVDSGCVITADGRIDNRDELLDALGPQGTKDTVSDAELILLAYLSWGERCLDQLLGDFAFAIWDPRHRILFCARDGFGMRPFYYHHAPGKRFVFASSPRAILALPQVPYQFNDGRIGDFLVPELQWIDYSSTFFEEVFRLPPGCCVTVSPAGVNIREYWRPAPGPELGPKSDEDYQEGFLDVFEKAVAARLRAPTGAVGSMLSGGMDSGSVVAVAKDLLDARGDGPLPTYSAARRSDVDCAESRAIHAATKMPAITPTLLYPDEVDNLHETLASGYDEPFDASCTMLRAIYSAAQSHGRRVLLDGGAGDIVLNEGSYIVRLIRQGRLNEAWRVIRGYSEFWYGTSFVGNLAQHSLAAITPRAVKGLLRPLRQRTYVRRSLEESVISREFADHVNIPKRFTRYWELHIVERYSDPAVERCEKILPNVLAGRERYARLAANEQIEARDPFLDKRVVEYCATLPGRVLMKNGWPKAILRDLMRDRLPDEVRTSTGKPHVGWLFNRAVIKSAIDRGDLNLPDLKRTLANYTDLAALDKAWKIYSDRDDVEQLHNAHALFVWLRENERRPVASK